jgi:hypothetical protein
MLSGKDLIPFSVDVFSVKQFWACVNIFFIDTKDINLLYINHSSIFEKE